MRVFGLLRVPTGMIMGSLLSLNVLEKQSGGSPGT